MIIHRAQHTRKYTYITVTIIHFRMSRIHSVQFAFSLQIACQKVNGYKLQAANASPQHRAPGERRAARKSHQPRNEWETAKSKNRTERNKANRENMFAYNNLFYLHCLFSHRVSRDLKNKNASHNIAQRLAFFLLFFPRNFV